MFKVECYTGSKLQENPVAFVLRDNRYKVEEIIDRWYGEGSSYFKVKADDDNIYLLKYDKRSSHWEWVFYQDPKKHIGGGQPWTKGVEAIVQRLKQALN